MAEAHALEEAHEATTGYIHPGFEPVFDGHHIVYPHGGEHWPGHDAPHHEAPHHGYAYGAYPEHHGWATEGHHGAWGHGDDWAHTAFRPTETDHSYRFDQPHVEEPHYLHDDHQGYIP